MKSIVTFLFFFIVTGQQSTSAQSFFDGKYRKISYTIGVDKNNYTLYDFSRQGQVIKAKYFAQNAHSQYIKWRTGKQILLVTAGAFSDTWSSDAKPVGLCADNGIIINRIPAQEMDGMVVVYNTGEITVVDLAVNKVTIKSDTGIVSLSPRTSYLDRYKFLNWVAQNTLTLFQTQLVYSKVKYSNFTNAYYGKKRERRFLAICQKYGVIHHVVVDAPDNLELNLSSLNAKQVLEFDGFTVEYIMNLDTGDKNILYFYNGSYLENTYAYKGTNTDRALLENATNLLVYYKE